MAHQQPRMNPSQHQVMPLCNRGYCHADGIQQTGTGPGKLSGAAGSFVPFTQRQHGTVISEPQTVAHPQARVSDRDPICLSCVLSGIDRPPYPMALRTLNS